MRRFQIQVVARPIEVDRQAEEGVNQITEYSANLRLTSANKALGVSIANQNTAWQAQGAAKVKAAGVQAAKANRLGASPARHSTSLASPAARAIRGESRAAPSSTTGWTATCFAPARAIRSVVAGREGGRVPSGSSSRARVASGTLVQRARAARSLEPRDGRFTRAAVVSGLACHQPPDHEGSGTEVLAKVRKRYAADAISFGNW